MKRRIKPQIRNAHFWNLSDESLRYIAKDAKESADNLPDCDKAGIWEDEVNDACTVMSHRMQKEVV